MTTNPNSDSVIYIMMIESLEKKIKQLEKRNSDQSKIIETLWNKASNLEKEIGNGNM
jgi:uncharacterized coiled-coil protein SlyX